VSTEAPTPWNDAVRCGACSHTLLPPTYLEPPVDDPTSTRPQLKCPECGQGYRWHGSAGWQPVGEA